MQITKKMLDRADAEHFRKEDEPSLIKLYALSYLYYKQKGQIKTAKKFLTREDIKRYAEKLETKKSKVRKNIMQKRYTSPMSQTQNLLRQAFG